MYRILRPVLFCLPPEVAHTLSFKLLNLAAITGISRLLFGKKMQQPMKMFGLTFPNYVGIAAGVDKNGDYLKGLDSLGVGFIEVGGVTPKPQAGNPKPRLHRLIKDKAIINWMGLNNKGIDYLVDNLKRYKGKALIGVNLAKGHDTSNNKAEQDYLYSLAKVYPYAHFAVINVSCPNSSNVDDLQQEQHLSRMLQCVMQRRDELQKQYHKKLPVLIKVGPDSDDTAIATTCRVAVENHIDGIIATNTSLDRSNLSIDFPAHMKGGLSGAPIKAKSLSVLQQIKQYAPDLPVISVGGIASAEDAQSRLNNGASLIQIYSALVYEGPGLIRKVFKTS